MVRVRVYEEEEGRVRIFALILYQRKYLRELMIPLSTLIIYT